MTENLVVVGVDDSPTSQAALEWAADYARMIDARLTAVHVQPPDAPAYLYSTKLADVEDSSAKAYRRVSMMFGNIAPEYDWRLVRVNGRPGEQLVKEAENAVLLVVGTQDHVGVGRLIDGSVSHYCIRHSSVPVLSYPNPRRRVSTAPAARPVLWVADGGRKKAKLA